MLHLDIHEALLLLLGYGETSRKFFFEICLLKINYASKISLTCLSNNFEIFFNHSDSLGDYGKKKNNRGSAKFSNYS